MQKYRFGLFCSLSDNTLTTNRTCTLKSLNKENILHKVKKNAQDLISLLEYAQNNKFSTFRLGNSFIPFVSHKNFEQSWLKDIEIILDEVREKIQDFDVRITQHPGQYTLLNSPNQEVIDNSLRELEKSFWLFERLGISDEGVILIHGGGGYGDKEEALKRLYKTIQENSWLKKRLALENDERVFTAQEISELCLAVKIPFIYDIYHDTLNPSFFSKEDFLKSFGGRRPKIHLSSKGKGRFGNHGDIIKREDFQELQRIFGAKLYDIDIMIEAKQKEKAIKKLREELEEG